MLQKFQQHINKEFPFLVETKIGIAISGGMDSVVLTHLMQQSSFAISLVHCNFKLRKKESDADEIFVKQLAKNLEIPCFTKSFDTEKYAQEKGISIQMAARNLRYTWFQEIAKQQHLAFILTAHHVDDSLETFLINLSRGTGLDGLLGIPKQSNNIVRPLLIFSRETVAKYATENAILWREDTSNTFTKYQRNKIRHQIIPALKELNPTILDAFSNTISHLKEAQSIVLDGAEAVKKQVFSEIENGFQIDIAKLKKHPNYHAYLYQLLKPYNFTAWKDVSVLLDAQSGKQIFSNTHRLLKNRDFLLLSKQEKTTNFSVEISEKDTMVTFPFGNLQLEENNTSFETSQKTASVDKDLLKFPLIVRTWQKGDYFYPLGMQNKKKLSKFFKDEKYSLLEKEKVWLLCNADNQIIWVGGKRQDNRFKITKKTTKTIKITIV